jgi:hypothetical protein
MSPEELDEFLNAPDTTNQVVQQALDRAGITEITPDQLKGLARELSERRLDPDLVGPGEPSREEVIRAYQEVMATHGFVGVGIPRLVKALRVFPNFATLPDPYDV